MSSLQALIIDDESLARYTLKNKLAKFPLVNVIGEAGNIKEAIKRIHRLRPQLLFLDIQLSDGTGFDLLERIEYSGHIIFVTAYNEYAIRAFEINAVDYLLKPISDKRLKQAIERLDNIEKKEDNVITTRLGYSDRVMIINKKAVNFIIVNTITYIRASGEYSYSYTTDGKKYLTSKKMSEWEMILPEQYFCRINRSVIISLDSIIRFEYLSSRTAEVVIHGEPHPVRVSRIYFKKLKDKYLL